jgi:hypothetical protein
LRFTTSCRRALLRLFSFAHAFPQPFEAAELFGKVARDCGRYAPDVRIPYVDRYMESMMSICPMDGSNIGSELAGREVTIEPVIHIDVQVYPRTRLQAASDPSIYVNAVETINATLKNSNPVSEVRTMTNSPKSMLAHSAYQRSQQADTQLS